MARCVVYFSENKNFVNIEAQEIHEEDGFLKVYNHLSLVGVFKTECVKVAYISEREG